MTGTGLKKCRPTTRDVLCWPSASAAVLPSGMVAAAILVILIEEVFVARIVLGERDADSERTMVSFSDRFSEAA